MKLPLSTIAIAIGFTSILAMPIARAQNSSTKTASAPSGMSFKKNDVKIGSGKEAANGKSLTVHYSGWLLTPTAPNQHGVLFDSSVGGKPFTFLLGSGKVIKGWDQGLVGMKVGGKRTLIIPAELGYGVRGAGPIPPNANLIFDIELLEVK